MKKLFYSIIIPVFLLLACNNNEKTNEEVGEDVDPYRQTNVSNVNGNIPDTTHGIDLSTDPADTTRLIDSTYVKDSLDQ